MQSHALIQIETDAEIGNARCHTFAPTQLVFVPTDDALVEVDRPAIAVQHRFVIERRQAAPALHGRWQNMSTLHAEQAHITGALLQAIPNRQALVEREQGVAHALDQQGIGLRALTSCAVAGQAVGFEFVAHRFAHTAISAFQVGCLDELAQVITGGQAQAEQHACPADFQVAVRGQGFA